MDGENVNRFGHSVAMDKTSGTLAIGARGSDSNAGSAYVYAVRAD